jgi:FKBP-type peptidyl-prolyl cis-trans isomerase
MIRFSHFFITAVTLAVVSAVAPAQTADEGSTAAPAEAPPEVEVSLNDQALQAYGWMIGQERGLFLGFSEAELKQVLTGLVRNATRLPQPANIEELIPIVENLVKAKAEAFEAARVREIETASAENLKAGEEYIAELVAEGNVEKTSSGLHYTLVDEGIGRRPSGNDIVRIRYTGKLVDGTVFDASENRGDHIDTIFSGLIRGFQEGLEIVREGGSIKLIIPPDLGYGNEPNGGIPPGSTLIFDVELIELNPMDFDVEGSGAGFPGSY